MIVNRNNPLIVQALDWVFVLSAGGMILFGVMAGNPMTVFGAIGWVGLIASITGLVLSFGLHYLTPYVERPIRED